MKALIIKEFYLFVRDFKNRVVFGVFILATVYTALIIVPDYQPIREVDRESYEAQIEDAEYIFENFDQEEYQRTYELYEQFYELNPTIIEALEEEEYHTFLELEPQHYSLSLSRFGSHDPNFFDYELSSYEQDRNQQFFNIMLRHRYQLYLNSSIQLSEEIIEERTVLQTIKRMLNESLPYILIVLLVAYGFNSVNKDKKHSSVLNSLPISYEKRLWAKTIVLIIAYSGTLLLSFLFFSLFVGSRYGMGSVFIPVGIYGYDYTVGNILGSTILGMYLFQASVLLFFITLIYSRGMTLLNIITRHDLFVLVITLPTIFISGLWNRTGVAYVTERYSFMPPTYFNIGEALSGRLNFVYTTSYVTFGTGVLSLSLCWLIIECILFFVSRLRIWNKV